MNVTGKRISSLLLPVCMALALLLTACGGDKNNSNSGNSKTPVASQGGGSGHTPTSTPVQPRNNPDSSQDNENRNIPAGADEIGPGIYNEEEVLSFLIDKLAEAGYDMEGSSFMTESYYDSARFGETEVTLIIWGKNTEELFVAEKRFVVSRVWELWEYDVFSDDWLLWD